MEGRIINLEDVELVASSFRKMLKEQLEAFGGTVGHYEFEMVPVHWGIGPEQIGVSEHLLEGAYGFDALCRKSLSHMGEHPKAAFVLTVEGHFCVSAAFGSYQFPAVAFKVFLKSATLAKSFFTWDFLAIFTDAPK